jgi:lauroyl/myristoyl acyltransferase
VRRKTSGPQFLFAKSAREPMGHSVNPHQTRFSRTAWWLKDALDSGLTRLTWIGLSRLPERRALRLARCLAPCFAFAVGRKPHTNARRFFDPLGWSNAQFERFHAARHDYLARLTVDCSRLCIFTRTQLLERTTFVGLEHVKSALADSRGLLFLGAHMGSFPLLPFVLNSCGYKTSGAFRPVARGADRRFLRGLAGRFGTTIGLTGRGALPLMRETFRRNECFFTVFDINDGTNSTVCLPFGHTRMRIALGPALLAVRCRVPVAYVSTCQLADGRNCVTVKPVNFASGDRATLTARELSARLLQLLHQDVVACPAQWWMWGFQDVMMNDKAASQEMSPAPGS